MYMPQGISILNLSIAYDQICQEHLMVEAYIFSFV